MNRARRALLKDRARRFASGVVWNIEAVASGQFDDLDLSHDEQCFIEEEMRAISRRIRPTSEPRGEDSAEVKRRFSLEWIAGARPPVHPNPMRGRQSFRSFDEAITFMGKLAVDAQFVLLTEYEEREFDRSEVARAALAATRSGSASLASGGDHG